MFFFIIVNYDKKDQRFKIKLLHYICKFEYILPLYYKQKFIWWGILRNIQTFGNLDSFLSIVAKQIRKRNVF